MVVPVLVTIRIRVGAWISLRFLVRPPPFLVRIPRVGRRNVRFFLVHALLGNLRGCRSFHVGCYRKVRGRLSSRLGYSGVDWRLRSPPGCLLSFTASSFAI